MPNKDINCSYDTWKIVQSAMHCRSFYVNFAVITLVTYFLMTHFIIFYHYFMICGWTSVSAFPYNKLHFEYDARRITFLCLKSEFTLINLPRNMRYTFIRLQELNEEVCLCTLL